MSHAFDAAAEPAGAGEVRVPGVPGALDRAMRGVNHVILLLGGLALVGACLVLSYSVVVRYILHIPTEWQDEMAVFLIGFFLPPVSIILMTAPIILPPLKTAGFDLVWFGVVMTITMEMGLIHPPVGLNIFVIKNIAPDIPLKDIIWGTLPFVILMAVAILILCLVPGIAMWLPNTLLPSTR